MTLRRRIILGIIAVLVLLPSALMYVVVTTESGLRLVASRLDGKVGPVTLTIRGVHGTLRRGFGVESLRIEHRYSDILITGAKGRLRFAPLLVQRISLPDISVESVHVISHHVDNPKSNATPHFLPRLLEIDAGNVRIGRAQITAPNGTEILFNDVSAAATVYSRQLLIHRAELRYQDSVLKASGRMLAAHPLGLNGSVDLTWRTQGQPEWHAVTQLKGDLDELPMVIAIDRPFHATVRGSALTLTNGWKFQGSGDIRDFDLQPFGGGKALGLIAGSLDIHMDQKGFTARGALDPAGLAAGPIDIDFAGAYAQKKLQIQRSVLRHAGSRTQMNLSGSVELVTGGPALDLVGEWTEFRWPLAAAKPAFRSPRGSLHLKGLKPWQLEVQGDVVADPLPVFQATLVGALASDSLQIQRADLVVLRGTAVLSGEVRWNPRETWQVKGTAQNIDPSLLRHDLPGKLGFGFTASGAPFGEQAALDIAFDKLGGQLRGQKAAGQGKILRAAGSDLWQFQAVNLRFGKTHILLDGKLGAAPDIDFTIEAEDLSLINPEARGQVNAHGHVSGPSGQRIAQLKAKGTNFSWRGAELDGLDADVDINPGSAGSTRGTIELSGFTYGGRRLQTLSLTMEGTNAEQHLAVSLIADPLRVAMTAEGTFDNAIWTGQFKSFNVNADSVGGTARRLRLALETPAPLKFGTRTFLTEAFCLMDSQVRFCLDAQRTANTAWNVGFAATSLPLHVLTAGLSQDMTYDGILNIEGKAAGAKDQRTTGEFHAQLSDALIRQALANNREQRMPLGSGRVDAVATKDAFETKVSLDSGASGNIKGELAGQRIGDEWGSYPIRGSLTMTTDGLGLLEMLLGSVDRATGRLSTDVSIAGTLGQPEITGELQLRDAQIDVYQVNLALRDLSLDARFNAENLEISGQSRFGEGIAKFNGSLAWRNREPFGDLHVEGDRLRVVNVPEGRIEASPRLDFRLAGRRIDASGEVLIPYARLAPADLTNAVLASRDEELVGAPPIDPMQRWVVASNLKLVLGDQVNVDAFGLTARLGGSITVRTDPGQITRGQGELNVVEGKFVALGRRLDIEHGRLIFNNGPINDPGIDLRAQKEFPDIIAGVNVRGTLRSQRMTFFSEPSIPQQQIATLILAGGSLASVQSSGSSNAQRSALLAQGGAILAQQYGSKVGIDDVGIETDLSNETSLVFGRYLSDKLYISYGISLAEAINTLKLRYTIGDRWTLKTESGKAKSADLEYTIRK